MPERFEPKQPTVEKKQVEEKIDLKNFLVKPKTDYRKVIQAEYEEHGRELESWDEETLFTEFGEMLANGRFNYLKKKSEGGTYEAEVKILKEKLAGRMLIDLGSGGFYMSMLANELGVRTYLSVDKFAGDKKVQLDPYVDLIKGQFRDIFPNMERIRVKDDMLDFIARVPQGSACVTISGIDMNIIATEAYHEALAKEIMRVLPPGGIVFGNNSHCLDLLNPKITQVLKAEGSGFKIFEKFPKKLTRT